MPELVLEPEREVLLAEVLLEDEEEKKEDEKEEEKKEKEKEADLGSAGCSCGTQGRRRELAVPWPARGAIAARVSCARARGAAARG